MYEEYDSVRFLLQSREVCEGVAVSGGRGDFALRTRVERRRVAVSALRPHEATDESQPFARVQEQLSLRARSSRPGSPGSPAGKPVAHL